jgi:hypothetical protein
MNDKRVLLKLRKDTPGHEKGAIKAVMRKTGCCNTDLYEVDSDYNKTVYGDPIIPKYNVSDTVTFINQKLKIIDIDFIQINCDWVVEYILDDAGRQYKIFENQLT